MRIGAVTILAIALLFQVGCASTLSPTATPMRLQAYNDDIALRYVAANRLERQGKLEQALEIYQELHEKHPKNPDYLHRLAVVNTRLQRHSEAAISFERARHANPRNVRLLADMGYSAYLTGDLPGAERILRDALRLAPTDHRVVNNLALVVGSQGKMDESLALLRRTNSEADALGNLAYIHVLRGESDLAESRYRDVLIIDSEHRGAIRALAQLAPRPGQITPIAALVPASFDTSEADARPSETKTIPDIQQASMTIDANRRSVVTANFEEPVLDLNEPSLLEVDTFSNALVKTAALIDDEESSDDADSAPAFDFETPGEMTQDDSWAKD